ncbi:unnamed protein product [Mytilus edulis]|uniref:C-type lectin domain-containing protein n=1 Tax=Mytilus edulis TaxID=6550 RepID=A0A8S3SBJ5_MYTED|nr:unnamed protein product [Mytilus edulis]
MSKKSVMKSGTGTDFSPFLALLPLLLLGLLAATTPTATAAQAAQAAQAAPAVPVPVMVVSVTVAPTPPCVSETCPNGFMLLPNQGISTTCYSDSGAAAANDRSWNAALTDCTSTPGAYLWRPNTEQEADAVRNKYTIPDDEFVWTGANLNADGTFRFAIENGLLDFADLPFGAGAPGTPNGGANTDCVGLRFTDGTWEWVTSCVTLLVATYASIHEEFVHREFAAIVVRPGNFIVAAWCNKNIEADFSFL